jgi:hypothetical protein
MTTITFPYGLGKRKLSPTIAAWFAKAKDKRGQWSTEGLEHDLILMATSCIWRGNRKIGGINFTKPKVMDRLENLQAAFPTLTFFTGVFPRLKGQSSTQILWYSDTELGTEDDLQAGDGA